jgi:predicted ATPase
MFVNRCGNDIPLEMAGAGAKRFASWVHELMEIKQILAEPMQRNFVQKSKLVILKDPERDLSPNEQLAWFEMWRLVMESLPNVYWIIETKSPLFAEFLQSNIRREQIIHDWVRIFAFTVWNVKGLPFNVADINEHGDLSGTISHHFDDRVNFQRDNDFIDKYVSLAAVVGGN